MNAVLNKKMHALLAELNMQSQKGDMVYGVTRGRTSSSREMSIEEAELLIYRLDEMKKEKMSHTKKLLIHRMCLLGYTTAGNTPDYSRINNFLKTRSAAKKGLNYLSIKEMHACAVQVEAIYKATLKKLADDAGQDNSNTTGTDAGSTAPAALESHSSGDRTPLETSQTQG